MCKDPPQRMLIDPAAKHYHILILGTSYILIQLLFMQLYSEMKELNVLYIVVESNHNENLLRSANVFSRNLDISKFYNRTKAPNYTVRTYLQQNPVYQIF